MKMNAHFLYLHGTNIQFTLDLKKKKEESFIYQCVTGQLLVTIIRE